MVKSLNRALRPVDLARRFGLSTQAVRNYEQDGCLPEATRTAAGYRNYTELHAAALGAYLALIRGHSHGPAGTIMRAANTGDVDGALRAVDESHARLQQDRATLDAVRDAIDLLADDRPTAAADTADSYSIGADSYSIGAVAHRLGVTAATVRAWERAGILDPRRNPATGHRDFGPEDLRDAELTRLLRRGGERLDRIATVIAQVRGAGSTEALAASLADWQDRLVARGVAMITADGRLANYLDLLRRAAETDVGPRH